MPKATTDASAHTLRALVSPHLQPLFGHLADRLRRAPLPPLDDEIIVVQSQGMREWLRLKLADDQSCVGSVGLPFPRALEDDAARWVGMSAAPQNLFSRELLTLRVDALLRDLNTEDPTYAGLRAYLRTTDDAMRFGLATNIAARFDDYQVFRPDMLEAWERGEPGIDSPHAIWQAELWRTLNLRGKPHRAARMTHIIEQLRAAAPGTLPDVPSRLSVFGVSSLPPRFIDLFAALSRHSDVCVYAALLPDGVEHPLAEQFGTQGRAMLELLRRAGGAIEALPAPLPRSDTVLGTLQHQLRGEPVRAQWPTADTSLMLHSGHGMRRELEIIRDQLYDAFASDPSLHPEDVLLLVPDITKVRSIVESVFRSTDDGPTKIPCTIADRLPQDAPAAAPLLRLLAMQGGRLKHSEVMALLAEPLIRNAVGLERAVIDRLSRLTSEVNVRWGYDDRTLQLLKLPTDDPPTWRHGLDRLLVGWMVGPTEDPILGVLPAAGDTAGDGDGIATLSLWIDRLGAAMADWNSDRPLLAWADAFTSLVEDFLKGTSAREHESIATLLRTIRGMAAAAHESEHTAPVSFSVAVAWLEQSLDEASGGGRFLDGKMTVAALKPMRSVPFRVIAIAGLDDDAFPRRDRYPAFDLIAHEKRLGDRSLREDDRQLFLDLLLAARDRFILTYSGRTARDNSECAVSVVVDEVLAEIERNTSVAQRMAMVIQHPLQPFSPRYFPVSSRNSGDDTALPDDRLFTYSHTAAAAATQHTSSTDRSLPFVDAPVQPLGNIESQEVALGDLVRLWQNPSQWFCERVLKITLPADRDNVRDVERFGLSRFGEGGVRSRILGWRLAASADPERERRHLALSGDLPPGALGRAWHRLVLNDVEPVVDAVYAKGSVRESKAFRCAVGEWTITGTLDNLVGAERVLARAGEFRAKHRIQAWVEHVVMCAARQHGTQELPYRTVLIGTEKKKKGENTTITVVTEEMPEVQNAIALVATWMSLLTEAQRRPLPFFGIAGSAYLDALQATVTKTTEESSPAREMENQELRARAAALKAFITTSYVFGDDEDPYIALCFRQHENALDDHFQEFAQLARILCPEGTLPWH